MHAGRPPVSEAYHVSYHLPLTPPRHPPSHAFHFACMGYDAGRPLVGGAYHFPYHLTISQAMLSVLPSLVYNAGRSVGKTYRLAVFSIFVTTPSLIRRWSIPDR
jgi:hypothetical protein